MTMSATSNQRKQSLRAHLLELTGACPFDECNPEDCPLSALRQMDQPQRLQWFNALTDDDLAYLAAYHHVCLSLKVESGSPEIRL
jgi:hypothetical protein